jgi:large-conductance mechanosensitive channel
VVNASADDFIGGIPMRAMGEQRGVEEESPAPSDEVVLLTDIRDALRERR